MLAVMMKMIVILLMDLSISGLAVLHKIAQMKGIIRRFFRKFINYMGISPAYLSVVLLSLMV